ncbi:hypothetical protein [Tabrizicola sp. YIM 78059]|uniref:hypothetical protein n=1 Tax=Tabrizicola sp. YIM 78059 TaxID=2529861 RepID=UPI0010AB0A3F|nr:hypothetical protein [Tabrizicola sp. YIM 78059]
MPEDHRRRRCVLLLSLGGRQMLRRVSFESCRAAKGTRGVAGPLPSVLAGYLRLLVARRIVGIRRGQSYFGCWVKGWVEKLALPFFQLIQ